MLSPATSAVASPTINYTAIAADQVSDTELQCLKDNNSWVMEEVKLPDSGISLYADVSTDSVRSMSLVNKGSKYFFSSMASPTL